MARKNLVKDSTDELLSIERIDGTMPTLSKAKRSKKKASVDGQPTELPKRGTVTTAIHIKRSTWNLLRRVAFNRSMDEGGRASVSKLIEKLVAEKRTELEREGSELAKG